jgi:hypothetical protein
MKVNRNCVIAHGFLKNQNYVTLRERSLRPTPYPVRAVSPSAVRPVRASARDGGRDGLRSVQVRVSRTVFEMLLGVYPEPVEGLSMTWSGFVKRS